jgi:hypothetical protein
MCCFCPQNGSIITSKQEAGGTFVQVSGWNSEGVGRVFCGKTLIANDRPVVPVKGGFGTGTCDKKKEAAASQI